MLLPKEVADYASGFNEIITDFIHRLRTVREPSGSEKQNEVFDLDQELFKWSFESVAEMLFDKRFGSLEPEVNKEAETFIKAVGDFMYNIGTIAFLPNWFYKIYETKQFKTFISSLDTLYEYAEMFIERRINELEEQPKSQSRNPSEPAEGDKAGFFEFLLSSGKLTKDDLLASVIDVLFGGVDTTSNTMQWMLYMMAKNPDKQEILRQEVLSVLGDTTLATPTTIAQMPYLKAWLRETLRLYPALSIVPRKPAEDLVLSGYLIPGGTAQLNFLNFYMGRDEKVFKDAEAFIPERWLRNKDAILTEAAEAFSSIPFGFGTRMCLGRRIAELELHLLLARIVQQFEISYPHDAENVEPFMRGVTIPDRALRVKFVDRQ
ncbi:sterol 26-hydroxylase, mitochondrial-like [Oculina patagonica]